MKRLAVALPILLAACVSSTTVNPAPPVESSDAEPVIRKMNQEFGSAARAGNVDALLAYYADDAVLMPPGAPAMNGRAAIRAFWSAFLGAGTVDVTLTTDRVIQSGDLAVENGHFDLTITPKSGAPIHDKGKYAVAFRKSGGDWKIVSDIFNSDLH